MAQKREKEETELKVPESLPMCTPAIPVSSSPATAQLSDDPRSNSLRPSDTSDPDLSGSKSDSVSERLPERSDLALETVEKKVVIVNGSLKRPRESSPNRCSGAGCRRKLGLMGFRCRCGDMFCSEHRYSDRHDCSFDYKAAGREAIARENPVVKAAKILKV